MRFLFCCLFFVAFFSSPGLAAQPDSSFVELFPNLARVNTGLRIRERSVTVATPSGEEFQLQNKGLAFRIGGRYRFASYTFSLPISDLGLEAGEEQSKNFGLGLTLFMRQQLVSGRFRNTRGFRSVKPGGGTIFREDVDLFTATIYGFQVLNNSKFSLRASFKQRDRQLKTSGSWLLGGLIDRQLLTSDRGIAIPFADDDRQAITRLAQTKFGVGLGYAHTFIFGKHFFLTPFAIAGPEFRFVTYDAAVSSERDRERLHVSGRLRSYLAFGYNGRRTAVALTALYLPARDVSENLETRFDEFTVELRVTRRFLFPDSK